MGESRTEALRQKETEENGTVEENERVRPCLGETDVRRSVPWASVRKPRTVGCSHERTKASVLFGAHRPLCHSKILVTPSKIKFNTSRQNT
jgi:hypothetical protein